MNPAQIPEPTWRPQGHEYHADRSHWSPSMLSVFRDSPALAWHYFVAKDMQRAEPSIAIVQGSVLHLQLLQPELVDVSVVVSSGGRRSKEFAAAREWAKPGQYVLTAEEFDEVGLMARAIREPHTRAAELAGRLLFESPGYNEYAFRWQHPASSVPCKTMLDRLVMLPGGLTEINLKTTREVGPEAFARQFHSYDYHVQGAMNGHGVHTLLGEFPRLIVIAVHNDPPFEVGVFQPSIEFFLLGERQMDRDLDALARCLVADPSVPWSAPWEEPFGELPTLEPPAWAKRELQSF